MPQVNDKWSTAEASLPPEVRPLLEKLKADYQVASKTHVPGWKGGPNPGILAELIRMGWRKPD
jgi:hypothetical protein